MHSQIQALLASSSFPCWWKSLADSGHWNILQIKNPVYLVSTVGQTKLLTVLHILHLSGYLCWDMKRRKGHGKIRHSRTETSSQLAWKPVTKHCGKIQTRSGGEAASKSWHHLRSLRNSALRQLNDILELITGFQMTMNSCPVCKAICIWVKCRFGKSGSPISTNACSKGKHPTAQGLPSRACFWEIGKQAMASTNPRLSFSPCYLLFLWCAPSAPRATLLPPMPLSPGRAAYTSQQQHFLKHWAIWRAICNPGAAQWWGGPVVLAALHSQPGVQQKASKSRIKPQLITHLSAPHELTVLPTTPCPISWAPTCCWNWTHRIAYFCYLFLIMSLV